MYWPADTKLEASAGEPGRHAEREMEKARRVQAKLLPGAGPRLATLEYTAYAVAARGVSGDYYDFIKLSPRRLALAVGDIAGKGMPAALMMASLQASLRSHYALRSGDLVARLQSMNRLFYECTAPGHFATLFLGEYDDRTRDLRYANCGHLPGLLLRGDGSLEQLGSTAMVLGIRERWECVPAVTRLAPGDTLLLYTDGATEARGADGEEFGEERLAEALRQARGMPLPELVRAVARAVGRFCGDEPTDDLTLVVARPRPEGAVASLTAGRRSARGRRAG